MAGLEQALQETPIHERAKIEFSRAINAEEFEDLLLYIWDNMPCTIQYCIEDSRELRYEDRIVGADARSFEKLQAKVGGNIRSYVDTLVMATFNVEKPISESRRFNAIQFFVTPGYDYEDTPKEEVKLWDSVREQVKNYFKEQP